MSWQNSAEWANFCLSINVSFYSFSIKWELKLWNKNPGLIILALCDSGLKVLCCVSCFARFWRIRSEFLNCDLTSDVPFKSTRGHNAHVELYLLLGLFACLSFRFRALRSRVCVCVQPPSGRGQVLQPSVRVARLQLGPLVRPPLHLEDIHTKIISFNRAALAVWNASVSSERLCFTHHHLAWDANSGSHRVAFQPMFTANIQIELNFDGTDVRILCLFGTSLLLEWTSKRV